MVQHAINGRPFFHSLQVERVQGAISTKWKYTGFQTWVDMNVTNKEGTFMETLQNAYLEEIVKSRVSLQKEWGTHGQQPQQPEATKQTKTNRQTDCDGTTKFIGEMFQSGAQWSSAHWSPIYLLSPVSPPLLHPPTDNPDQLVELGMGQTPFSWGQL